MFRKGKRINSIIKDKYNHLLEVFPPWGIFTFSVERLGGVMWGNEKLLF